MASWFPTFVDRILHIHEGTGNNGALESASPADHAGACDSIEQTQTVIGVDIHRTPADNPRFVTLADRLTSAGLYEYGSLAIAAWGFGASGGSGGVTWDSDTANAWKGSVIEFDEPFDEVPFVFVMLNTSGASAPMVEACDVRKGGFIARLKYTTYTPTDDRAYWAQYGHTGTSYDDTEPHTLVYLAVAGHYWLDRLTLKGADRNWDELMEAGDEPILPGNEDKDVF